MISEDADGTLLFEDRLEMGKGTFSNVYNERIWSTSYSDAPYAVHVIVRRVEKKPEQVPDHIAYGHKLVEELEHEI